MKSKLPFGKKNENASANPPAHTSAARPQLNKNDCLTFSQYMLAVEGCPVSQSHFFAGKTHLQVSMGKELLCLWRSAGYPHLGEWPPDQFDLFDWAIASFEAVLNGKSQVSSVVDGMCHRKTSRVPNQNQIEHKHHVDADEVKIPLSAVASLIQSKTFGQQTIQHLAGTTPLAHHLKALSDLWKSLGCPNNVFWRSTYVFYNRIQDAPDSEKT